MNKIANKNHNDTHNTNLKYAKENGWVSMGFKKGRHIFRNKINGLELRLQPGENLENNATAEN